MPIFDQRNMVIGTAGSEQTPLTDANPAAYRVNIKSTGDTTTGGESGKHVSYLDNDVEVASISKAGVGTFAKVLTNSKKAIQIVIDGGAADIATGIKGEFSIPISFTLSKVRAYAFTTSGDGSGSIVVDLWKSTYASYSETVPGDAETITASAPITITTAVKSEDATLTGWTTSWSAGDVFRVNVDSCTDIKRLLIYLEGSEV